MMLLYLLFVLLINCHNLKAFFTNAVNFKKFPNFNLPTSCQNQSILIHIENTKFGGKLCHKFIIRKKFNIKILSLEKHNTKHTRQSQECLDDTCKVTSILWMTIE